MNLNQSEEQLLNTISIILYIWGAHSWNQHVFFASNTAHYRKIYQMAEKAVITATEERQLDKIAYICFTMGILNSPQYEKFLKETCYLRAQLR